MGLWQSVLTGRGPLVLLIVIAQKTKLQLPPAISNLLKGGLQEISRIRHSHETG